MLSRTGPEGRAGALLPVRTLLSWSHEGSQRLPTGQTQTRDIHHIKVRFQRWVAFPHLFCLLCGELTCHLVLLSAAGNQTTWNLLREPTSWPLLVAVVVEEGLDRTSADLMISSASANRTLLVRLVCTWMTLWRQSLKTLQHLLDFCPLNGLPRAPPNPPPEDCSPATEAGQHSTARLASSLHHNLKASCCPVRVHTRTRS